eukprot:jgi/Hompol1/835/HPOL_000753-RA
MLLNLALLLAITLKDSSTQTSGDASTSASQAQKPIPHSLFSFKALTECPIIIALLFQIHRKFIASNIPLFVPSIVQVLMLQPPQQQEAHNKAEEEGGIFLGMAPAIKNSVIYGEFKSLQVKVECSHLRTVSFVAYIIRSFIALLRPYEENVAKAVVCLMKDCPPDASGTRKELLVATRHLWYTEFRSAFVPHINLLLNDDVLVGTGVTCRETLRPLAHSVLVDLIHHVRDKLTLSQISKIIHIYSRNLHDPLFPPQIQTMCAKLLISLIDNIIMQPSKPDARRLLVRTLDSFASRLGAIHDMYPIVLKYVKRKAENEKAKASENNLSNLLEMDGYIDLGYVQPIMTSARPLDGLLLGIKTALFALRSHTPPASDGTSVIPSFSHAEEVEIFVHVFQDGLSCFEYFSTDSDGSEKPMLPALTVPAPTPSDPASAAAAAIAKEDKDTLEAFASIFTLVDPSIFQEVFTTHIEYLFNKCITNPALLSIPQYFLANVAVSANYSALLLSFLVDRLADLGGGDTAAASVMLRLFKLLFMAVTLFPDSNEAVLRPHLANIIMSSLRLSAKAQDPMNYFSLLRALFRSIGGGRFEQLYQEVLPLLQVLLETLNTLLASAHQPYMKELFVELCLTVPVRFSVLLPFLSFFMRPLIIALQAGPELVSQSLRTLELCVDNLNHEFLEP